MSTESDLLRILARLDLPAAAEAVLRERFADSVDLAKAGEPGIALENVCDNLFEFEVMLDVMSHRQLRDLCLRHGVSGHRIDLLNSRVVGARGFDG